MTKIILLKIICLMALVAIGYLVSIVSFKVTGQVDNPAEQYMEQIIKDLTGVDIDFTPDIP